MKIYLIKCLRKLNQKKVEFSHSYIDFGNHFTEFENGCDKYSNIDPHGEAPVIYTNGDLWIAKYHDITTHSNAVLADENRKTRGPIEFYANYAGLYNNQGQGI